MGIQSGLVQCDAGALRKRRTPSFLFRALSTWNAANMQLLDGGVNEGARGCEPCLNQEPI